MDAPSANLVALIRQHLEAGRYEAAEAAARTALRRAPRDPGLLSSLGIACVQTNKTAEGIAALRKAAMTDPSNAAIQANLAAAYVVARDYARAVEHDRRAVQIDPGRALYYSNLGNSLRLAGRLEESLVACERALQLDPTLAATLNNLAATLKDLGRIQEGIAAARKAVAAAPHLDRVQETLWRLLEDNGDWDEATAVHRRLLELQPDNTDFPMGILYLATASPTDVFQEHRTWARRHAEPLAPSIARHANDRDPHRRLRIGYVSPDFRGHPVSHFFEPVLEHHDRSQVEVFLYYSNDVADAVNSRLHGYDAQWRQILDLGDADVADMIVRDQIDILVDLALHSVGGRMLLFARKPAPVQATWLAYAGTSGLTTIDWRITDGYIDPPGLTESLHTERLLRLPKTQWVYRPSADAPDVSPPPFDRNGFVTFGWAGTWIKLQPLVMELWARVLQRVPNSRLRFMSEGFDLPAPPSNVRAFFAARGIAPDRLDLRGRGTIAEYFAFFAAIDVILDTYPFAGGTTTCHSLWMGVPVITRIGPTPVSRVAASILRNLDLGTLVADSPDGFVDVAVNLAADPETLRRLRQTLRQRFIDSPLRDEKVFTRDLENAYRFAWQSWCAAANGTQNKAG